MKKKLLSLVLAGAMVASTSVSAFATTQNIQEVTTHEGTANVEIKGFVHNNEGVAPSGTISVSIPTSLQFKVDKEGNLTGTNIDIVNNGLEEVEIIADKFVDNNPSTGIKVKTPDDLEVDNADRSNVVLWIQGKSKDYAYFKTDEDNKNGIYNAIGQNQPDGIKISQLSGTNDSNNSDTLQLKGYAGKLGISGENGISDQFTLILKVKKVRS